MSHLWIVSLADYDFEIAAFDGTVLLSDYLTVSLAVWDLLLAQAAAVEGTGSLTSP